MRIAIISHLKHPISEPFAGGLEMHTHLLATKLKERGNEVTVFAAEGSVVPGAVAICPPTVPLTEDDEAYAVCDAREHRAYLQTMNHLRGADFDVIHNNALHYLPLDMAPVLDIPMVTALHTPPFAPLESAVAKAAGRQHPFISVSNTIADQWAKHRIGDMVIPNGIDLSRFTFHERAADRRYAVWFGRIVPEKGLHHAIKAARLAGLPLHFAGPIHDAQYFHAFIAPLLGADTIYEGHLDHARLAHLIGGASVFLCTPCWEEPFGLVVAEALASGVPVAAFARGAIPKILDASSGMLAAPDDAESLASIAVAASQLSRRACRRRAELVCDVETMIDGYVDCYNDLTAGAAGVVTLPIAEMPAPAVVAAVL